MEKIREQLQVHKERAILVGVTVHRQKGFDNDLQELTALAETAGALIIDRFQQKISRINSSTYIGKGKAEMLGNTARPHCLGPAVMSRLVHRAYIRK